ncbi:beta-glucosidase 3-like [Apium graveolens]|uniref:beta-glucosidase 3-like n=2 Tax=Apium graveolens TaxID=4045 RepID=UPI003D7A5683
MNGDSPDVIKKNAGKKIPSFTKTESLWLKGSLDFVGVNHYASGYIKDQTINLNVDSRDVMADMAVQLICTLVFTLIQFHTLAAICLLRKLLAQSLNQRFSLSFPNYLLVQGEEMVPNNIRGSHTSWSISKMSIAIFLFTSMKTICCSFCKVC